MLIFFAVKSELLLNFALSEAGYILRLFLFFEKFEPQCSYKHGSYKTKSVYATSTTVQSPPLHS